MIRLILFLALTSCTYSVHQVPISDFRPYVSQKNGRNVEGRGSQFVILGFASDTNYANLAFKKIQAECPGGAITGIATKYYTEHGFFSWTNHVVLQGLCVQRVD